MRIPVAPDVALHARHWPGDGAAFLLVHGLASNARMWDGVAERLSDAGHRVLAIDQRGHGRSDKPDDGYDFLTLTNDLLAVIDHAQLGRPFAAGQSWGANVVIELAHNAPSSVRAIACVDGGTRNMADRLTNWEDAARVLAPPQLAGTPLAQIEAYFRTSHPDWPESGVEGALANFDILEDGTVAPWLTRDRHMAILRQLWEHRPTDLVAGLTVPVLNIPASDHGADHDIHAQMPDLLVGLLLEADPA